MSSPFAHEALVEGNYDVFLAATGAGATIQSKLWERPGSSAYLVGAVFPYARHELTDFLGFEPEKCCSKETAIAMAMSAYVRAAGVSWRNGGYSQRAKRHPIGIGVTASVSSNVVHRGDHVAHIAILSDRRYITSTVEFGKNVGLQHRMNDEQVIRYCVMTLLGLDEEASEEHLPRVLFPAAIDDEAELMTELTKRPLWGRNDRKKETPELTLETVFFPGTFNPLHMAHIQMAHEAGRQYTGRESVTFMVNANPAHKPPMKATELLDKVAMVRAHTAGTALDRNILFTLNEPLLVDKVRNRPQSRFCMGADTLDRVLDPKWGPTVVEVCEELIKAHASVLIFSSGVGGGRPMSCSSVLVKRLNSFDGLLAQIYGQNPCPFVSSNTSILPVRSSDIRADQGR